MPFEVFSAAYVKVLWLLAIKTEAACSTVAAFVLAPVPAAAMPEKSAQAMNVYVRVMFVSYVRLTDIHILTRNYVLSS
jgi:hypothetical protein